MYEEIDYLSLERLLKQFIYKPGWKFEIDKRHQSFIIHAYTIDSDKPDSMIVINHVNTIPVWVHPKFDWVRWLHDMIVKTEIHECDEFFRIGDDKPFYPHSSGE